MHESHSGNGTRPRFSVRTLCLMVFGLFSTAAVAQTGTITGTVQDATNQGLPQANLFIQELQRGAVADLNGRYTIADVPVGTYTLRASYAGYETQLVPVTVRAGATVTQNFSLVGVELTGVVVEGYRVRRAPVESGATALVTGAEVENLTVRSADAALQGRAAGVRVTSASGQPGAGLQVQVRGSGSITAGTTPLYIVDGIQLSNTNQLNLASGNALAGINPQDIESIEVLKDAAASAIYGAEAANGVVLISTKRGRQGRTQIEFSSQVGSVDRIKPYEVLSAEEYLNNRWEALYNRGILRSGLTPEAATTFANTNTVNLFGGVVENGVYIPRSQVTLANGTVVPVNTRWQDEVFRTGLTQQYTLSARGGNERTTFFIRGSRTDDEGQVIASRFQQYGFRLNLDHSITNRVQVQSGVNLSSSDVRGTIGDGAFINSPYWAAQFLPATVSLYNEPGNPASGFNLRPNATFSYNPVAQETFDTRNANSTQIFGNLGLTVELMDGLFARSYGGLNHQDAQEADYRDPRLPPNQSVGGRLSVLASRTTEFNLSQTLQYNRALGAVHALTLLGGTEYRRGFEDDVNTRGAGFPNNLFRSLANAATPEVANSFKTEFRRFSLFGNGEYTYDNTYQVASTLRYDGSSRFGTDNRFGLFGTIAGFTRLSRLQGVRDLGWVNDLKVRASYGVTGNSEIGNFLSRQLIGGGGDYAGRPGIRPTSLGNNLLTWEQKREANIGLDYGFFAGRLSGTVDIYSQDIEELLLNRDLPTDSGFSTVTQNIGTIRQQGVELGLNTVNVNMGGFRWGTTFNIAFQRAEVLALVDDELDVTVGGRVYRVGEAPAQIQQVPYAGVNPANGRPMYFDINDNITYAPTVADLRFYGNDLPNYFGGLGNQFSYAGVSLDVFFQYDYGRTTFNNDAYFSDVDFDFNKSTRVLDRWQRPGDITAVPAPLHGGIYADGTNNIRFSSRFVEDASYIRLKQLALGYAVPAQFLRNVFLQNATVYIQGENLATWTAFTGFDPEVVGTAIGRYPQSRRIIAGLRLGL